jgi:hypothetical protein
MIHMGSLFDLSEKGVCDGASKGIGYTVAVELARQGADVLVTARDTEGRNDVAKAITSLGREAQVITADLLLRGSGSAWCRGPQNLADYRHPRQQCRNRSFIPGDRYQSRRMGYSVQHQPEIRFFSDPANRSSDDGTEVGKNHQYLLPGRSGGVA